MSFDYGFTTTYLVATLFLVACDLDIYSGEPHLEKCGVYASKNVT